jgi:predicted Zn-dependent peptidase
MSYAKYNMGSYNLHIIKTDKFKTINVQISFRRPIKKEEITIRNFLSDLLLNSSLSYPSNRLLSIAAEELYGLRLFNNNIRLGNYVITTFDLSALNEKYTEPGMLGKSLDLLFEVLFNPNIKDHKFDSKAFKIVKNGIEAEIQSTKDNMTKYSLIRMLEEMDDQSPISYRGYGYLEDLDKINEENIYEYYQSMLRSDMVDIFVLGDVDDIQIKHLMEEKVKINTIKKKGIPVIIEHSRIRQRLRKVIEKEDVNQSKLSIGCKTFKLTDNERKYTLGIYSIILGGPTGSRLFNVVREKHSLAYTIASQPKGVDNLLLIYGGIDKDKFEKTVRLVKYEMNKMKKGFITEDEVEKAKNIAIGYIKTAEDSPKSIIDTYFAKELIDTDDLETKKKEIMKITKEDVLKVANKLKIDTVFLLEGGKTNASNESE